MNVTERLLSINKYTRPGRKLDARTGLIYHFVGIQNQRAGTVYNFFENDCPRAGHYSSAHDCVDIDGQIYHFVPYDEVAYHCGTEKLDPASQKVYTDWARNRFGRYAMNPASLSPNLVTIGIELCFTGVNGEFTEATLKAAAELGAKLCRDYQIPAENIGTHHQVVGWKECPLYWAKRPEEFERFRERIITLIG